MSWFFAQTAWDSRILFIPHCYVEFLTEYKLKIFLVVVIRYFQLCVGCFATEESGGLDVRDFTALFKGWHIAGGMFPTTGTACDGSCLFSYYRSTFQVPACEAKSHLESKYSLNLACIVVTGPHILYTFWNKYWKSKSACLDCYIENLRAW